MKRVIFSTILFFGLISAASAQTESGSSSKTTGAVSKTSADPKNKKAKKPSEVLNNRRIYHFKNGQRSTPTGAEATSSGVGGGYAALGRNVATSPKTDTVAVASPVVTQRSETNHAAKKPSKAAAKTKSSGTKAKRKS